MKLNLSYNQIANISGLQAVDGPEYKLSHIELQGNCLISLDHVGRCLEGATNLRRLVLSQAGAQNPCCNQKGKYSRVCATCLAKRMSMLLLPVEYISYFGYLSAFVYMIPENSHVTFLYVYNFSLHLNIITYHFVHVDMSVYCHLLHCKLCCTSYVPFVDCYQDTKVNHKYILLW